MSLPHAILFQHQNFAGAHRHVFAPEESLGHPDDNFINNRVSSIVVLTGNWEFFREDGFSGRYSGNPILGPGRYTGVGVAGITADTISSLKPTDADATISGIDVRSHIIVFTNSGFRGSHRHVFAPIEFLGSREEVPRNSISSLVILNGHWEFFREDGFSGRYPGHPILRSGALKNVEAVGIDDNSISSLRPTSAEPTVSTTSRTMMHGPELILFRHRDLRGPHQHVPVAADVVDILGGPLSFVILNGNRQWGFFRDSDFSRPFLEERNLTLAGNTREMHSPILLGPGLYRDRDEVGIGHILSLRSDPFFWLERRPDDSTFEEEAHVSIFISWTGRLEQDTVNYTLNGNQRHLTDLSVFLPSESAAIDELDLGVGVHRFEIVGKQGGLFLDHRTRTRSHKIQVVVTHPGGDGGGGGGGPTVSTAKLTVRYRVVFDGPPTVPAPTGTTTFTGQLITPSGEPGGEESFQQDDDWTAVTIGPNQAAGIADVSKVGLRLGTWRITASEPLWVASCDVNLQAGVNDFVNLQRRENGCTRGNSFPGG
jgi:hypothetical protein